MIDIENFIFDKVAAVLREQFPGIYVTGEYIDAPPRFPAVSIVQESNSVNSRGMTFEKIENAADVMFAVNVYDNTVGFKKSVVKDIVNALNSVFDGMGFRRSVANPISNLQDATIYRMNVRYSGTVELVTSKGEDGTETIEQFYVYPS